MREMLGSVRRAVRRREVVYLVGAAGYPNYGDEAIARAWLRHLARTHPDAEVWLDCHTPGAAALLFRGDHPRLRTTDFLWRMCWDAPSEDPEAVAEHVTACLADPARAPRLEQAVRFLRSVDRVHLLGGGYVNGVWPRHVGLVVAAGWLAAHARPKAAATGLGLTPADDRLRAVLTSALASFDVVTVRDERSFGLVAGVSGVRQQPDDILLDELSDLVRPDAAAAPEIMVCVQSDLLDRDFGEVADAVRATLEAWGATSAGLGVMECIPGGDSRMTAELREDYPGLTVYSAWDVLARGVPAAAHQRWVTSRYHPHVVAAAVGARGATFSVRPDYYDDKHDAVRQLGSGWSRVVIGEPVPEAGLSRMAPFASAHRARVQEAARRIYG